MKSSCLAIACLVVVLCPLAFADEAFRFQPGERVVFLGDSITHAGGYIVDLEARLRTHHPDMEFELINLGLPSETCSGLSEPAHPFPRPDVHERLARALDKAKPDVVFACYGMNDGIYHPFSAARYQAYQLGVDRLIRAVQKSGARLVLMTPPPFDPLPLKAKGKLQDIDSDKFAWFQIYKDYDDVLKKYAAFVSSKKGKVAAVIDLHTPINEFVAKRRAKEPKFTMSGDGVHLNGQGHQLIADIIWKRLGYPEVEPNAALRTAVARRQQILHAAWLSHVGHKRPGMKAGLPLSEAAEAAAKIKLP